MLDTWKTMEYKSNGDTNCNWFARYGHQRIGTGTEGLVNKRTNGNDPNYIIIRMDMNTEKSPGELKIFAVSLTSVRRHLLKLVEKFQNSQNIIDMATKRKPSEKKGLSSNSSPINTIRTNYIKANVVNTQKCSTSRLWAGRDETLTAL